MGGRSGARRGWRCRTAAVVVGCLTAFGPLPGATAMAAAPRLVADLSVAPASSDPQLLGTIGDRVLVVLDDGVHGREPWVTDGTAAGTRRLADVVPGGGGGWVSVVGRAGASILLEVGFPLTDRVELWATDGSSAGSERLATGGGWAVGTVGDRLVFESSRGGHGREPWITDGTAAGTRLVADIRSGPKGAAIAEGSAAALPGALLFVATDGQHGLEPWITDGTPAGTRILRDVRPGMAGSCPDAWGCTAASLGPTAVVLLDDGSSGWRPWITDGTAEGTWMLDLGADTARMTEPPGLAVANGRAWFVAPAAGGGSRLWTTDGTRAGTLVVASPPGDPGDLPGIDWAAAVGARTVLTLSGELWTTDGTAAATAPLGWTIDRDWPPMTVGARLLARADRDGPGFVVTDGTVEGTLPLGDAIPGLMEGHATGLTVAGGHAYLAVSTAARGTELWVTDGTSAGTRLIRSMWPAEYESSSCCLQPWAAAAGDRVVFPADDGRHGVELWTADGSGATGPIVDASPGNRSTRVHWIAAFRGTAVALTEERDGYSLRRLAGHGSPRRLGSLQMTASHAPYAPATAGHRLYLFHPHQNDNWTQLVGSDGTRAGTRVVATVGSDHSVCGPGLAFRGRLIAGCWNVWLGRRTLGLFSVGTGRRDLRRLIGFETPVMPGADTRMGGVGDLVALGSRVAFVVHGVRYRGVREPVRVGAELWITDGTRGGTHRVAPLDLGAAIGRDAWARPPVGRRAVSTGQRMLLIARDAVRGEEPWVSDGTAAGTHRLADVRPGSRGSVPRDLAVALGGFAFSADDGRHGREPWVSDGTAGSTRLLGDLRIGAGGSDPSRMVQVGTVAFFTADDGMHGREVWVTDGTTAGTRLVRDVRPGPAGSRPRSLTRIGRFVVFAATDGAGTELWRSDGSAAGTRRIADLRPGRVGSDPRHLMAIGRWLWFTASDGVHGREIWRVRP